MRCRCCRRLKAPRLELGVDILSRFGIQSRIVMAKMMPTLFEANFMGGILEGPWLRKGDNMFLGTIKDERCVRHAFAKHR